MHNHKIKGIIKHRLGPYIHWTDLFTLFHSIRFDFYFKSDVCFCFHLFMSMVCSYCSAVSFGMIDDQNAKTEEEFTQLKMGNIFFGSFSMQMNLTVQSAEGPFIFNKMLGKKINQSIHTYTMRGEACAYNTYTIYSKFHINNQHSN